MSISDYINDANRQEYKPGKMTIEELKKLVGDIFIGDRQLNRPVTIHTGIGGAYTFDYYMAKESGLISKHMTKKHGRLMRIMGMGLAMGKVVDENGIVWMVGRVNGKGYYFSNMHQKVPVARKEDKRFRVWEYALETGASVIRNWAWPTKYAEQYAAFKEKHDAKAQAKLTGVRIKGTVSPEDYWQYHDY